MSKNKSEFLINRKDNQYEVIIGLEEKFYTKIVMLFLRM